MLQIFVNARYDFVGKRRWFYALSLGAVLVSLLSIAAHRGRPQINRQPLQMLCRPSSRPQRRSLRKSGGTTIVRRVRGLHARIATDGRAAMKVVRKGNRVSANRTTGSGRTRAPARSGESGTRRYVCWPRTRFFSRTSTVRPSRSSSRRIRGPLPRGAKRSASTAG